VRSVEASRSRIDLANNRSYERRGRETAECTRDLAGEVIDTERSTSRRNSIVQSERCGEHAEPTSEASRFLPAVINQLLSDERTESARSRFHTRTRAIVACALLRMRTRTHRAHETQARETRSECYHVKFTKFPLRAPLKASRAFAKRRNDGARVTMTRRD